MAVSKTLPWSLMPLTAKNSMVSFVVPQNQLDNVSEKRPEKQILLGGRSVESVKNLEDNRLSNSRLIDVLV
jgi:hypothetical protein